MEHPLDNPVWHALTGPHARFAIDGDSAAGRGLARHYDREVAPFSAITEAVPAAYADLAASLPAGTEARLLRSHPEPLPSGWVQTNAYRLLQMELVSLTAFALVDATGCAHTPDVATLDPADSDAMLELVDITKPGPFARRTVEMGRYIGVREKGKLIAMAGERMRVPGHVELSAICTHPEARGRGLGTLLMRLLVEEAFHRGETPFLHVRTDNIGAIALYQRLGFVARRELLVRWLKPVA